MISINKLQALGIHGRLILAFSLLIIPVLIVLVVFLTKINSIEFTTKKLSEVIVPIYRITTSLDSQIYETQIATYEWVLTKHPLTKADFNHYWEVIKNLQNEMKGLESKLSSAESIKKWNALKSYYSTLQEVENKLIMAQSSPNNEQINQIITDEVKPLIIKMIELINGSMFAKGTREGGINEIQVNDLSQSTQTIQQDMSTLRTLTYMLLLISVLLAIIVFFLVANQILEPVKNYREYSSKIAAGDLRERLVIERADEIGKLGHDLNKLTDGLALITRKINEASHSMFSILDNVKQASDIQSTGISEQASSINEITASLAEIDKSAIQTMEKAKILGQIAEQTSQKGQIGLNAVDNSIEGMKSIHDKVQTIAKTILELSNQTQQIGEITNVVNSLALQSKMLALNASIEAAKAGEAGKGFAVVAAEVRNLAEQSEQSTTQVQKILEDIRRGTEKAVIVTEEGAKGVAQGTNSVEQMGAVVHSLTEAINETMVASQQIEAAVRQESLGIEQITLGMNEINQVTASFVNSVKQTTQLIEQLGEMVRNIKHYIDVYKV